MTARIIAKAVGFTLLVLAFAAAHTQRPLYYSNQNHRFLHGLAHAGIGYLPEDWLANTADPTPLFSLLVEATCRWGHIRFFYVYQVLITAVYLASLVGIAHLFFGPTWRLSQTLVFVALFVFVHSTLLNTALGGEYVSEVGNFLHTGVAGQYVLGPCLQPSVVGVFLIASVCLFVYSRPYAAVFAAALAATLHSTYLLSAAFLTLSYVAVLVVDRRSKAAMTTAGMALLAVAPVVVYTAIRFQPSSPEEFATANAIMAHKRFPHHTDLNHWLNMAVLVQVILVLAAIVVSRDRSLPPVMLISLAGAFAMTFLQNELVSDSLALLFPWRASVWLVPTATTVLLARSIAALFRLPVWTKFRAGVIASVSGVFIAVCAGDGLQRMSVWNMAHSREAELFEFVKGEIREGQVWLVPVHLETFRLATGAPIFVDYKSHPYKDAEVLNWKQRLDLAESVYADLRSDTLISVAFHEGITHVVTGTPLTDSRFELAYRDQFYVVYRLRPGSGVAK